MPAAKIVFWQESKTEDWILKSVKSHDPISAASDLTNSCTLINNTNTRQQLSTTYEAMVNWTKYVNNGLPPLLIVSFCIKWWLRFVSINITNPSCIIVTIVFLQFNKIATVAVPYLGPAHILFLGPWMPEFCSQRILLAHLRTYIIYTVGIIFFPLAFDLLTSAPLQIFGVSLLLLLVLLTSFSSVSDVQVDFRSESDVTPLKIAICLLMSAGSTPVSGLTGWCKPLRGEGWPSARSPPSISSTIPFTWSTI